MSSACAAVLASDARCGVLYLGPDLPAADIAHAAKTSAATRVVLGATTPDAVTRGEAKQLARELSWMDLWVGGPQSVALVSRMGFGHPVETFEQLMPLLHKPA